MARLNSAAAISISRGMNEILSVSDSAMQIKLSEIILANKDTEHTAKVAVHIYKAEIETTVVIIPNITLQPAESNIIKLSTHLSPGDAVLVETNVANQVDTIISCVEFPF